jgi:hypothetical protein
MRIEDTDPARHASSEYPMEVGSPVFAPLKVTDEKDKAVLSLGATDGSRAEYILKQMRKSNDPNGVLREFKRRRLVTAAVMDYINQAQNAVEGR